MNPDKYKVRITARIASEFAAHREQQVGATSNYPAPLKKLVLSGLAKGLKPSEVAAAAQLTTKSIYNWNRCRRKTAVPSELKLVPSRAQNVGEVSAAIPRVKIRIGTDVTIELVSSDLSLELLQRLSQLELRL